MQFKALIAAMTIFSFPLVAATNNEQLQQEVARLQQQTRALQTQLNQLQKQLVSQPQRVPRTQARSLSTHNTSIIKKSAPKKSPPTAVQNPAHKAAAMPFHSTAVTVHTVDADPESLGFYPTALIANDQVVTYIAGTPVVSSPYLGSRPAFDGSDYIVNISSINRDIRLMQQRRRLYRAYDSIGYPAPNTPIIALSGKVEPLASLSRPYLGGSDGDVTLGSSELDVAAVLNDKVEAYIGVAYVNSPPVGGAPRVDRSLFGLNMGFVNIGDLDETPYYFTGGQLYVPFGRFSSAMISAPLTLQLARTKSRPFILGYKSQEDTGPFAAVYGFKSDTTLGSSATGGVNLGYTFAHGNTSGEIGASFISSLDDATGMQVTGSATGTTFGGFSSYSNGSEQVHKVPGVGVHGSLSFDRYNLTAEWVGAASNFRAQDLSYNGHGAIPQALQLEAGVTFMAFNKPASAALGYQWSQNTLALNMPQNRISGVFNISFWKDTVESLEYRHDIDFKSNQYANGAAPSGAVNANTLGTGKASDTLLAQIGVYF